LREKDRDSEWKLIHKMKMHTSSSQSRTAENGVNYVQKKRLEIVQLFRFFSVPFPISYHLQVIFPVNLLYAIYISRSVAIIKCILFTK
jgi:hypothetical protein